MTAQYVATFYTHYDAIQFARQLAGMGIQAQLMPVPRSVSSSCGTCARFETALDAAQFLLEGVEAVFRLEGRGYVSVCESDA